MFEAGVAAVAVAAARYHIDKAYDYLIPASMGPAARAGVRVMVPFGGGNRLSEGIILSVSEEKTNGKKLKALAAILDPEPVVDREDIRLALWMRERCFCTLFDALRTMLPVGVWFRVRYTYRLEREEVRAGIPVKSEAAKTIVKLLEDLGGEAELEDIRQVLTEDPADTLRALVKKGVLLSESHEARFGGEKTVKAVELAVPAEDALELSAAKKSRAPLQSAVLELLAQTGSLDQKELCYFTGASSATVKALERQGVVVTAEREVLRRPGRASDVEPAEPICLNAEQTQAFRGLKKLLHSDKPQAALLWGVTGSGKTSVYIKLITECLQSGRRAIVLVPEIALTPQLVGIFMGHFGDRVAVLHSSLKSGERYDEYRRIKAGSVDVVVGTRSAVFAPLRDIGLIILDEEQESTYKSESTPRYHARDIAKYRCARGNALLLLGSATPSVESMHAAQTGRYHLFTLNRRYNTRPLPRVILADLREELRRGNTSGLSLPLVEQLQQNLAAGEQSILFVNRRGASRAVTCVDCGHVPGCPRCSVSLTYHSVNHRLMCHYCGYSEKVEETCPRCGGTLKFTGFGTQRIQEELEQLLPEARVLRMDADTVTAGNPHEKILSRFARREADILLGTQMVTKGLDFENVTLVGVLDADMSLYADDFRAAERTFSLLTQVVGRSGRGSKSGRAVIQTYTPHNEVIRFSAEQDYMGFYRREIELRQALQYPPFRELFAITASGLSETAVMRVSTHMRDVLIGWSREQQVPMSVLGPAPARVTRVNNRYRYRITVACENNARTRLLLSSLIRQFSAARENRGVSVAGDLNPLE